MVCVVGKIPESAHRIGVLAGAFNPPTLAHLALLTAAAKVLDCVVCSLPREYPHKDFCGATLDQRVSMLDQLDQTVLVAEQGLFIEMAREFRRDIRNDVELYFLCGRDAAERVVSWNYGGTAPSIAEQLVEYRLLVARRQGDFEAAEHMRHRITMLDVDADCDAISSTCVRHWVEQGDGQWRSVIPKAIFEAVEQIYGRGDVP